MGVFIDVWFSVDIANRYSYHWERRPSTTRSIATTMHPIDWQNVSTWPKHFHNGSQDNVTESHISDEPQTALREFLSFARMRLAQA